jgi:hypothetical protein
MSKFILNEGEKNNIRMMYESIGIFLNEDSVVGTLARKALAWVGKNEDDIVKLFKTTELATAKLIDDIVSLATKSKSLTQLDDLQAKLMHFYNPSGQIAGVEAAKKNVVKFLNGYSKSKGKANWKVVRDEVSGTAPKPNVNVTKSVQNPPRSQWHWPFSSRSLSNDDFQSGGFVNKINYKNIPNWKGFEDLEKTIVNALKTRNFESLPIGGFENFGITNFRDFIKYNTEKLSVSGKFWHVSIK